MTRVLMVLSAGLLWSSVAFADSSAVGADEAMVGFAYETITVSSTALGFTTSTYAPSGQAAARRAFITCETDQVRYRYDGGTPTSSVGHILASGTAVAITGRDAVDDFRMIRVTNDATCQVTYER